MTVHSPSFTPPTASTHRHASRGTKATRAPRATTVPLHSSAAFASGAPRASRASTAPLPALPGASQVFRIDLAQGRELSTRQWWSLHTGHLHRDRKLAPALLAQRIVHKLDHAKCTDAAALLNRFFAKATTADGPSWLLLARRYANIAPSDAMPTPAKDALDLYRSAQAAGVLRDSADAVAMAQLLVYAGAASEAVGLVSGQQIAAPRDARLAQWGGIAWLAQACAQADTDAAFFASAQDRAVKALRLAAALSPNDRQAADNAVVAESVYPGPKFGNFARTLSRPFADTPDLRAALMQALDDHTTYEVRRMYAVGTAVRTETTHHRRQQNVDAIAVLRPAV